jgi:hypothetical protein
MLVVADAGHARVGLTPEVDVEVALHDEADVSGGEIFVPPDDLGSDDATVVVVQPRRSAHGSEPGDQASSSEEESA